MVKDVKPVSKAASAQAVLKFCSVFDKVMKKDISNLLRYYCDTEPAELSHSGALIITVITLPANIRARGLIESLGFSIPIFFHLHTMSRSSSCHSDGTASAESNASLQSYGRKPKH